MCDDDGCCKDCLHKALLHKPGHEGRKVNSKEDAHDETGRSHHACSASVLGGNWPGRIHHAQRTEVTGGEAEESATGDKEPVWLNVHRPGTVLGGKVAEEKEGNEDEAEEDGDPELVGSRELHVVGNYVAQHGTAVEDEEAADCTEVALGRAHVTKELLIKRLYVRLDDRKDGERHEEDQKDVEALLPAESQHVQIGRSLIHFPFTVFHYFLSRVLIFSVLTLCLCTLIKHMVSKEFL